MRIHPPHRDERLLDGVLRLVRIADDAVRGQIQATGTAVRKCLVGVSIAASRSLDQCTIHPIGTSANGASVEALTVSEDRHARDFQSAQPTRDLRLYPCTPATGRVVR